MRLTKLQKEFIDKNLSKGAYVAFPKSIFKSQEYKQWKKEKYKKDVKLNAMEQDTHIGKMRYLNVIQYLMMGQQVSKMVLGCPSKISWLFKLILTMAGKNRIDLTIIT